MERYKNIILKASGNVEFKVKNNGSDIVIEALAVFNEDYSERYKNPPVPKGYQKISGEWNTGLVIRNLKNNSEFVWIPVGAIKQGQGYNEKFTRRTFGVKDEENLEKCCKEASEKFEDQIDSVKKYGGFYVSRYQISKTAKGIASEATKIPWTNLTYKEAEKWSEQFQNDDEVKSHLIFGTEYDSMIQWMIENSGLDKKVFTEDSTYLGGYLSSENFSYAINYAGSGNPVNNIFINGNVSTMTQEKYKDNEIVLRGGNYTTTGDKSPIVCRDTIHSENVGYPDVGFRIALTIM